MCGGYTGEYDESDDSQLTEEKGQYNEDAHNKYCKTDKGDEE